MDVILDCPLGKKCEEIIDNKLHRCRWYKQLQGTDAQGNEHDEWDCAVAWMPILQIEVAGAGRNVAASIQSHRNELTLGRDKVLALVTDGKKK